MERGLEPFPHDHQRTRHCLRISATCPQRLLRAHGRALSRARRNRGLLRRCAPSMASSKVSFDSRLVRQLGVAAAAPGLIVAAGFASESALAAHFIVGSPTYDTLPATLVYVAAVLALAAVIGVVGAEGRIAAPDRGLSIWLIASSAILTVFFGLLSILGAQFWAASRDAGPAETAVACLLYFASFAGPAIASLASAVLIFGRRTHPLPVWLPSLIFLAVVGASVLVLVCFGLGESMR